MRVEPERDVERTVVMRLPPAHESWLPTEHPLYRPRHSGRQRTALVSAGVFFFVPMLLLVLGVRPAEIENRRLAAFPGLSDGWGVFTGLPLWATDHLPLRGAGISAADGISRGAFGEPAPLNDGAGGPDTGPVGGPVAPPSDDGGNPGLAGSFPKVIEGKNGWLYLGEDATNACAPQQSLDTVITRLRRLRAVVEASGRQFVLVVAPNKSTMIPEQLPDDFAGHACMRRASDEFWRRVVLEARSVDLRPPLRRTAAMSGQPIYSPFDTHWTFEGGMSLTQFAAETITPGISSGWKVTQGKTVSRSGDLPPLLGHRETYNLRTYELAPDGTVARNSTIPDNFEPQRQDARTREPLRLTRTRGAGVVPIRTAMIADSFAQFATPYLAATFGDLTVVQTDAVDADPAAMARLFAESDAMIVEIVERNLIAGTSPILSDAIIDTIGDELAKRPVR